MDHSELFLQIFNSINMSMTSGTVLYDYSCKLHLESFMYMHMIPFVIYPALKTF